MTWQEVPDPNSGRSYYYNTETGDVTWDMPPGFVPTVEAPVVSSNWTQQWDEGTGRYYYYNTDTGDVSWDQPEGYVNPTAAAEVAPAAVTDPAADSSTGGLPEGWIQVSDESGNIYYYNQATQQTSWEPPVAISASVSPVVEPAISPTTAPTQVKWIERYDPGSGQTYYEHPETHATQWHSPYGDASSPVEASEDTSGTPTETPATEPISTTAVVAEVPPSTTGNKVTDGMSLYSSTNLTLPLYSLGDSETDNSANLDQSQNGNSNKASKRNAYVFAPDEFAAEFISLGNKANGNANGQKQHSRVVGFEDDDNDDGDDDFYEVTGGSGSSHQHHGNGNHSGNGGGVSHHHGQTVSETMSMLNDYVEWTDINQSSQWSEQVLQTLPSHLLTSPKMLSALTRKLSAFTMVKFAENYFQFDRRGNQMLAATLEKLISYQAEPIKTSLTSLSSALSMEAITCFKEIQLFMLSSESIMSGIGMNKSTVGGANSGPTAGHHHTHHQSSHLLDIALNLIQRLILAPVVEFHDEIYVQIMKQVKRNPSIESTELGWQLMLMLLSSIPPSKKILPFLLLFCSQNVENLQDEAKKFAAFSLKICLKSALTEIRKELPTRREIQSVLLGEQMEVKVQVIDGQILSLLVDSFTTIKTFESTIAETLAITPDNYLIFALYEYREGKEKLLSTSDRVLDVLSTWEKAGGGVGGGGNGQQSQASVAGMANHVGYSNISQIYYDFEMALHARDFFFYKVHVYYFPANLEADIVTKRLLYAQAVQDLVSAYYPHTLQDGLMLASLQLHITHGDYIVGKEIKEFRSTSLLKRVLNATWLDRDDISRTEMESRMLSLYKKLVGIPKEMAMTMFLSYASTWKLYGAKYFLVKGQLDNTGHFTHDLVIALTPRSVIIIDVATTSFLADYHYDQIYSWGHSFDSFVLVIGSKSTQVKSYFRTSQGKEIEEMLKVYAHHHNPGGDGKDALSSSILSIHSQQ